MRKTGVSGGSSETRRCPIIRILFAAQIPYLILTAGIAHAEGMSVTDAWTLPNANPGTDAVLGMVLKNDDTDADALLRVSCPVANFSEKRQIDIGEGGKSSREIRSIAIPGKSTLTLDKDRFHIVLLQTTSKLDLGAQFECAISFRRAGKIQVPVKVLDKAPGRG